MTTNDADVFDQDFLLRIRKSLAIAHHIPGRIRLRVRLKPLKDEMMHFDKQMLTRALDTIEGIGEVRVNAVAGTAIVHYAVDRIPSSWWEILINGQDSEALALFRHLSTHELAPAARVVRNYQQSDNDKDQQGVTHAQP